MMFSLFDTFGNNSFLSASFSVGGNRHFGQQSPVQGTIPTWGENIGVYSSQGLWNLWKGSVPPSGMPTEGNPFHGQWNPGQGLVPMFVGSTWGNPFRDHWNTMHGEIPAQPSTSNYGIQSIFSQSTQYLYTGQGHGVYQNPGQQPNFSWQPGASQTPASPFPVHNNHPKLPFLVTLHFIDFSRLLNDSICHDPRWLPMPTKFPSDIPKFEGKPGEDPSDHVTTFHLWCSSNSLQDNSVEFHFFLMHSYRGCCKMVHRARLLKILLL